MIQTLRSSEIIQQEMQLFFCVGCTHLCGTLAHFDHLKKSHVLHPILLMMAIHPARTSAPPSSSFGLVANSLPPFSCCL